MLEMVHFEINEIYYNRLANPWFWSEPPETGDKIPPLNVELRPK